MTAASRAPGALPGLADLNRVCRVFGVDAAGAREMHSRSNAVYLLPRSQVVVRLAPATPLRLRRAHAAIAMTRWLAAHPHPVALAPLDGEQPVVVDDAVATFWPCGAIEPAPSVEDLATLLRRLHALPEPPPLPIPTYQPLHRLNEALQLDSGRSAPALFHNDRRWLTDRTDALQAEFAQLSFPLGTGVVHADAHLENLVHDGEGWLLIDWDQVCLGPRELDLLLALPDHFHAPEVERRAFITAYGYDLTDWSHWTVLRDIAELHSVASYIRLAPSKPAAARELAVRVQSLRSGDRTVRWQAIP